MAEPVALAITVACASLISGIVTLSQQIATFVSSVRNARKDMDAVSRELSSLNLSLEALRDDSSKINFPESLQQNLVGVLQNCDDVTQQMQDLLKEVSSERLRRHIQWSISARDDMDKLRSRLEAHKSAIDITLDMISIFLVKSVKEDAAAIRADAEEIKTDTVIIKRDTSQIAGLVQEIGLLRLQISHLQDHGGRGNVLLERFLAQSTTYAESVVGTGDFDAVEFRRDAGSSILEEGGTSDLESTHASENLGEPDRAREIHSSRNREQTSPSPTGQQLHLVSAPTPPQDSDAHGPCPPDHSLVDLLADPPEDGNALINQGNEPTGQKPQLGLDHKAVEMAAMARRELSVAEQGQLDEELLLLLDGRQKLGAALPGRNRYHYRRHHVGTLSEVVAVLDRGADPGARIGPRYPWPRRGSSALVIEIINTGRLEVIRLLLGRGADVNAEGRNYYGNALQAAFWVGTADTVRLLLQHGAEVHGRGAATTLH